MPSLYQARLRPARVHGGDIALSTFSNLVASYCGGHGIVFKGAIFESDTYSLKSKDCRGQGIVFSNQGGVVSNMMMYGTNSSRNALNTGTARTYATLASAPARSKVVPAPPPPKRAGAV